MKALPKHDIGFGKRVRTPFDQTVTRVESVLKEHGFGVVTRIDVKATLKEKLAVDVPPQVILGACNPALVHKALEIEPRVSLLLPCNVVVRQEKTGVCVEAAEPFALSELFPAEGLEAIAGEASDLLHRALEAL